MLCQGTEFLDIRRLASAREGEVRAEVEGEQASLADGQPGVVLVAPIKPGEPWIVQALPTCSHRIESIVIRALQATISRA